MAFSHVCGRCGRPFVAETRQRSFCEDCRRVRGVQTMQRHKDRKNGKKIGSPMPCPRCGQPIRKGKRMCPTCSRVRKANSRARSERLRRSTEVYSPPTGNGVPGELFAPNLTTGGWTFVE